jgi:hypothetical protein
MKIDWLWVGTLVVATTLFGTAHAQTAVSGASAITGSAAGANAGAQGNVINIEASAIPTSVETHGWVSGTTTLRTVPNVIAPNIFPTAPCMGSSSLGVGIVGTGVSGGTSWIAENCEHRENARLLHAMGDVANAKIAMCMQTTMSQHPMCAKPATQPAKTSEVSPRDPRVITSSEPGRTQTSKSEEDRRLTLAAMSDDPKREQCRYAREQGDSILAARFGCAK